MTKKANNGCATVSLRDYLEKRLDDAVTALKESISEETRRLENLEKEFRAYKETSVSKTDLEVGTKLGISKSMGITVAIVGFLWALFSAVSSVLAIYAFFRTAMGR